MIDDSEEESEAGPGEIEEGDLGDWASARQRSAQKRIPPRRQRPAA